AKNPNQASFPPGSYVLLTATAGSGFHFASWSGDIVAVQNPLQIWMDRNKNITATFAADSVTLTTTPGTGGTISRSPDQPKYLAGAVVQVTAVPDPGYAFFEWGGDASGSTNPISVTMNGNRTVTATFRSTTDVTAVRPERLELFPAAPN